MQADDTPDVDGFWEKVATNLDARRIRLLFVADKIPDELTRVVEFLNEQMQNIEVLAVEVKQFRGESMQTLVPRVIGRTAATSGRTTAGRGPRLTRETFLADFTIDSQRRAAEHLLNVAQESGAALEWGSSAVQCPGAVLALAATRHHCLALPAVKDDYGMDGNQRIHFWSGHIRLRPATRSRPPDSP